jgi:hypothetical protein
VAGKTRLNWGAITNYSQAISPARNHHWRDRTMAIGNRTMARNIDSYITDKMVEHEDWPPLVQVMNHVEYTMRVKIDPVDREDFTRFVQQIKKRAQKRFRERTALAKRMAKAVADEMNLSENRRLWYEASILRWIMGGWINVGSRAAIEAQIHILQENLLVHPGFKIEPSQVPLDINKKIKKR